MMYCIIKIVGDIVIKDVEYKILQNLVETQDFITIKEISKNANISERTVRYALDNIDYVLKKNGMPTIEKKYGLGLKVSLTRKQIDLLANKESIYKNYLGFSNKYRLILYLMKSHYSRTLQEIANFIGVSRITASKYLDEGEGYLADRNIELIRKRNKGIYIVGKELQKRRTIYDIIFESYNYSKIQGLLYPEDIYDLMIWNYFYGIDIKQIWEILVEFMKDNNTSLSDVAFYNIIINTCIMIKRIQQDFIVDIEYEKMDYISETFEYEQAKKFCNELSKKYNIVIPKTEVIWISMHFLGANPTKFLEDDIFSNLKERDKLINCIHSMVSMFEEEGRVAFSNKEEIINGLFVHLMPAINRAKYNIEIKNCFKDDIKTSYTRLYNITLKISEIINKEFNVTLSGDEISYICLHFVAAIEKVNRGCTCKKRVIVLCSTGVGTSKLLASKLKNYYEDIEIVDIISYNQFVSRNTFDIDYVISTVAVKEANVPVIVVNPLINKEDREELSKIFTPKVREKGVNMDDILNIIDQYCTINDVQSLQRHLKEYILGEQGTEVIHIWDVLTEDFIRVGVKVDTPEEAIKISGKLLQDEGYVNGNYVNNLIAGISRKGKNGPYIVISNGIALPHAKPEDGVYKTGFSMVVLKEPVRFGHKKHDPVSLIISFGTKNNKEHLKALEEITTFITNRSNLRKLLECRNEEEIVSLLLQYKEEKGC
ncbi:transcriptional regulatory protein [Clostridium tetanomorphum DSM 665]|nr:transcriptional regulatory protein [Clostridium tetanomorphum DSM 665]MBP1866435.1 transcriptional antiterminator/mannitol/fructose-specific phosphotransferase system IIA component (Ntr-type) [Clostridium tetanomorphum]